MTVLYPTYSPFRDLDLVWIIHLVSLDLITKDLTSSGEWIQVDPFLLPVPFAPSPFEPCALVFSYPELFSSGVRRFKKFRAFCTTSCLAATDRERIPSFDSCAVLEKPLAISELSALDSSASRSVALVVWQIKYWNKNANEIFCKNYVKSSSKRNSWKKKKDTGFSSTQI